jgi:hypothetical protein
VTTTTPTRLVVHNLDALLAFAALPVFAVAGWPLEGWFWAVALWAVNRFLQARIERRVQGMDALRAMGAMSASMLLRPWIGMAALFVITRHDRDLALAAVGLFMVLVTADIATRIVVHRQDRRSFGGTA